MCMIHFVLCSLGIRGIFKTLYFNLKYLPIKQGIRFPVLLSKEANDTHSNRGGGKKRGTCSMCNDTERFYRPDNAEYYSMPFVLRRCIDF